MEQNLDIEKLKFAREIGATHVDISVVWDGRNEFFRRHNYAFLDGEWEYGWAGSELLDDKGLFAKIDFTQLDEYEAANAIPAPDYDPADVAFKSTSDGSTASYYELPEGATELQDLISYRNMNAQDGEIFRAIYRKGRASHSDALRDAKKVLFYAQAEVDRLEKYGK